jgi:hypothetical protein
MSDISMPGLGVAIAVIFTWILSGVAFIVAIIAALLAPKRDAGQVLTRIVRYVVGPIACAACAWLYDLASHAGGTELLNAFDQRGLECMTLSTACGVTIAFAVDTVFRLRTVDTPQRGVIREALRGAGVVVLSWGGVKALDEALFHEWSPPTLPFAPGILAFAVIALTGELALRYRRSSATGRKRIAGIVVGIAVGMLAVSLGVVPLVPTLAQHQWWRGPTFALTVKPTNDRNVDRASTAGIKLTYKATRFVPGISMNVDIQRTATFDGTRFTFAIEKGLPSLAGYRLTRFTLQMPPADWHMEDGLCARSYDLLVADGAPAKELGLQWSATRDGTGFSRQWRFDDHGFLEVGFHCGLGGLLPDLPSAIAHVEYTIDASRFQIPVISNRQPGWTWEGTLGALNTPAGARLGANDIELSPGRPARLSLYFEKYYTRATEPETVNFYGLVCPYAAFKALKVLEMNEPRNWNTDEGAMDRSAWEATRAMAINDGTISVDLEPSAIVLHAAAPSEGVFMLILAADIDGEPVVGFSAHRVTVRSNTYQRVAQLALLAYGGSTQSQSEVRRILSALESADDAGDPR